MPKYDTTSSCPYVTFKSYRCGFSGVQDVNSPSGIITAESVAELFAAYLNPKVAALIKKAEILSKVKEPVMKLEK